MGQRTLQELVAEGQRLEAEGRDLLRKQITEGLTAEETARKAQLEGYLLGLVEQVQAMTGGGVGVGAGVEEPELGLDGDEDGDDWGGEEELDEGEGYLRQEEGYNPFRY
jgi:hypothetical protein